MRSFWRHSILYLTAAQVVSVAALVGLVFVFLTSQVTDNRTQAQFTSRLGELLGTVESTVQIACFAKDEALAAEVINGLLKNSEVLGVVITSGTLRLGDKFKPSSTPDLLERANNTRLVRKITSPFDHNEVVGEIQLIPNPQAYDQFIRENVGFVAMLLSVQLVVVVAAVLAVILIRIIRPIKGMSDGLHKMGMQNNKLLKLPRGQEDTEIGRLALDINHLTTTLKHANEDFRRLLDNSGEGFLTFGPDLLIDAQYSLACETMLGHSPAGCHAAELLFHSDPVKIDLFSTIITSLLHEHDADTRECMLSLLPTEITRGDVNLKAEYKALANQKFMLVLTDITAERHMATLLSREKQRLELIVMAVSDSRNFFETINAFRLFLTTGLPYILQSEQTPQRLVKEMYREIHTYKGLLSQFSFPNTPKVLHEIETQLGSLLSLGEALSTSQVTQLVLRPALQRSFDADLAVLSDALGEDFLSQGDTIVLTDAQARQLEKLAARLLRGETLDTSVAEIRSLLHEISTLRKVSFKDVLLGFDGVVKQAAQRMGKDVATINVNGGEDVWIDPNDYRPFLHSLVHVFRNAVAHGLETPEGRWEAKKDELGRITCSVTVQDNAIHICIADDGAGISLDKLRQHAVANGIYAADKVAQIPDDAITQIIFMDNISTQHEVSDLAGRGIGLAAVLSETKNAGGEVVVKTIAGKGTQFLFTLPLQRDSPREEDP